MNYFTCPKIHATISFSQCNSYKNQSNKKFSSTPMLSCILCDNHKEIQKLHMIDSAGFLKRCQQHIDENPPKKKAFPLNWRSR